MKKIAFLLFFAATVAQAQVHRFVYEYKFSPDINKKDSVVTDMMALDISDKGSVYQSLERIQMDSLMQAQFRNMSPGGNRNFNMPNRRPSTVQYKVTKEYPSYTTYLNEKIGVDAYKILEEEKSVWKIFPETKQIGSYKAQKATTTWGGRDWVAWFSTELPFQDGPYKFSGLPGLIVQAADTTGSHIMTLVGNKKMPAAQPEVQDGNKTVFRMSRPEIEITEAQYKKAYKAYVNDPSAGLRQMLAGAGSTPGRTVTVRMQNADGKEMDVKEMSRLMDKDVKDKEMRNNNKIEPSLYRTEK